MESLMKSAFNRAFTEKKEEPVQSPGVQGRIEKAEKASWEEKVQDEFDLQMHKAKIMVVGCGGAGCNTVTRLTELGACGSDIIAINTDAKHLSITKAHKKILIGRELTRGLGAGGYPKIGEKAAEENRTELKKILEGVDLLFVTAGLGGGTGTGSISIVSEIAKQQGAIVIGAVTMPFKMEGTRIQKAEDGLSKLRGVTDTVVVIENQKLLEYAGSMPIAQAFALSDELISMMIKGITETISVPSLVNLDFADVRSVMKCGGVSAICVGESDSQSRIKDAVLKAINHPLLEVDYDGALGALIHITCGPDCTLAEINEAGEMIGKKLSADAKIIWGARVVPEWAGRVQVIAIVTGVKSPYILGPLERDEIQRDAENQLGIPVILR